MTRIPYICHVWSYLGLESAGLGLVLDLSTDGLDYNAGNCTEPMLVEIKVFR